MHSDSRWLKKLLLWLLLADVILLLSIFVFGSVFSYWYTSAPVIEFTITAAIATLCAFIASPNLGQSLANAPQFIGFVVRRCGVALSLVMGAYLLFHLVVQNTSWLEYLWQEIYSIVFILRLVLFGSAILLGASAGNAYQADSQPPPSVQLPRWASRLESTRLSALIDRHTKPWRWLAIIASIPVILSLTFIVARFTSRGSFYGDFDHESITILRWESDHEIDFSRTNAYISDCVGCSPIEHSVERLDIDTGRVTQLDYEEISWNDAMQSDPEPPVISQPISPDGTKEAYVVNEYDIYLRGTSGLRIGWPVFVNPRKDFFTRYLYQLLHIFVASFLAAPLLLLPWLWKNRRYPHAFRVWAVLACYCIVLFAGSLNREWFSPFNILSYIFIPIP